ncbi:MAG TPA: substrate-binding domain-containing protein [Solirubrobacteraceae bacterium]|jgi:D-xylose transport system substrate-binding protein
MSLLKRRIALVGIVSVALTATLFATENSFAAKAAVTYKNLTSADFTTSFSAMKALVPLAKKGKGKVAVILPDTVSSTRWTEFDAPYLKKALLAAGLSAGQIIIQNAQGSDATFITDAQADITAGAKVILTTPVDAATGDQVEKLDGAAGVKTIDYDRLTLGGATTDKYYVSFNNVQVGKLEGSGLVACVKAWKVKSPKVIVNHGSATDNNATQFAQGYFSVLTPLFKSGGWTDLEGAPPATLAGTWDPPTAETQFQQAFTANPSANATLTANDATAGAIITYLQQQGVKPNTFPTTGQDASLPGLQNIISGYQCGTVYKAVFLEAQAAAALAIYLRAGVHPAKTLINGSTTDTVANVQIPSVLETPKWVTASTIEKTVVHDKFVPASQICAGAPPSGPSYAADCKRFGIK